ncbi:MAG: hypothetical protein P8J20_07105 [Novosphingobium sp.]|nr:hypothetical protein [Novosphingobium sp.]
MKIFRSRPAIALAAAAMFTMSASPAMARGGHRHHRGGVDGGDVFAGLLIFGGIAAIAAAASKSNREKREREQDNRYRQRDYRSAPDNRNAPDYREPPQRYGDPSQGDSSRRNSYSGSARAGGSMDGAVDICASEVERGDRQIETVESVSREANGWRVDGRISGGRDYSCIVDHGGQVRRVTVDGRAIS